MEAIVRRVHSCGRYGMGGYISAEHFDSAPFDAALIALAPLWKKAEYHDIEEFLLKWQKILCSGNDENAHEDLYVKELDELVNRLMEK